MTKKRNGTARGGGRGGNSAGSHGGGSTIVVNTMAPLEMFRRFIVEAARGSVPEPYRRRKDVFPCSYGGGEGVGGQGGGQRQRRQQKQRRNASRILVDSEGDDGYVVDAAGRPVVRAGVGLLQVPPGGRVKKIDYTSSSGRTSLTWRLDPDHAQRRLGRVSGTASKWSLQHLGVAGVVTAKWAVGQRPIMAAKRARAEAGWPATPDLRSMGYNRRERQIAERRDLDSGVRQRFPTGYEKDDRKEPPVGGMQGGP